MSIGISELREFFTKVFGNIEFRKDKGHLCLPTYSIRYKKTTEVMFHVNFHDPILIYSDLYRYVDDFINDEPFTNEMASMLRLFLNVMFKEHALGQFLESVKLRKGLIIASIPTIGSRSEWNFQVKQLCDVLIKPSWSNDLIWLFSDQPNKPEISPAFIEACCLIKEKDDKVKELEDELTALRNFKKDVVKALSHIKNE
jgi:hypothetical protein